MMMMMLMSMMTLFMILYALNSLFTFACDNSRGLNGEKKSNEAPKFIDRLEGLLYDYIFFFIQIE